MLFMAYRENVKDFEDFITVSATFSQGVGEVLDVKVFNTFQVFFMEYLGC